MRENMPEISFERSMNHNYMILSRCSFFGKESGGKSDDYRTRMLLENRIPGLLPVTHRLVNGESRYYYEINSLQSLDRLYDKTEIRYDKLRHLLSGCVSVFDRLEEYLLDGTQMIMKPEFIYIDVERMEPYFVCYPDYEGDVRISFMEFVDELLTRIDHTDERAVMLGYRIYRYTRNPNYVISEIGSMMEHVIVDTAHRDADITQISPIASKPPIKINDQMEPDDCFVMNDFEQKYEQKEEESSGNKSGRKSNGISDLIGGIFCTFVSLCSGAIILGARMIHSFRLGGNSELYLYGATGMAVVAAILFFSCYIKKRQRDGADSMEEDEDCGDIRYDTAVEYECDSIHFDADQPDSIRFDIYQQDQCPRHTDQPRGMTGGTLGGNRRRDQREHSETMYLGESVVEERMLCGRLNGRDVNISLDRLPMTVGKLASVVDFVINDSAVSKMHARFEEHDGRVCLRDLNSTNGTVRNGELLAVNQSVVLEAGDRIRFGRTSFTYC